MHLKEMLMRTLMTYFVLVTCITAAMLILGTAFDPAARFGYDAYFSPLFFAALGVLPEIVMYSSKELSAKQIWLRKGMQLILIETEIMTVSILSPNIHTEDPRISAGLFISVPVIFVTADLIRLLNSALSARKLTRELIQFQKNRQNTP